MLLDRLLEPAAGLVGRLAGGRALLGSELSHVAQQVRQLGLAAQVLDPDALEGVGVRGRLDRPTGLGLQRADAVGRAHGRAGILVVS